MGNKKPPSVNRGLRRNRGSEESNIGQFVSNESGGRSIGVCTNWSTGLEFTNDNGAGTGFAIDTTEGINGLGVKGVVFPSNDGRINNQHNYFWFNGLGLILC